MPGMTWRLGLPMAAGGLWPFLSAPALSATSFQTTDAYGSWEGRVDIQAARTPLRVGGVSYSPHEAHDA